MVTRATRDVLDLAVRPVLNADIDGGSIDGTPIGVTTPDIGCFTNLKADNLTVTGTVDFTGATIIGNLNAFYADVAENYVADQQYPPGTLIKIGGEAEVTATSEKYDSAVYGVVSSEPAFVLNSALNECCTVAVALVGRVPCRVVGPVKKGQTIIASDIPGVGQGAPSAELSAVGFALASDDGEEERLVEIAVRVR